MSWNRGRELMFSYVWCSRVERAAESSVHGSEAGETHSKVDDGRGAEAAGWGGDMEKIRQIRRENVRDGLKSIQ